MAFHKGVGQHHHKAGALGHSAFFHQPPQQRRHRAPKKQARHRAAVDPLRHIEIVHHKTRVSQPLARDGDAAAGQRLVGKHQPVREKGVKACPEAAFGTVEPTAQQACRKGGRRGRAHQAAHPDRFCRAGEKTQQGRQQDQQRDADGGRTAVRPPVTEHQRRGQQGEIIPFQISGLPPADIHDADRQQDRAGEVEPAVAKAVPGTFSRKVAAERERADPAHGGSRHHRQEAARAHRQAYFQGLPQPDVFCRKEKHHTRNDPKLAVVQEHPAEHKEKAVACSQLKAGVAGQKHQLQNDEPEVNDFQL